MTVELFREDAYLRECEATVIAAAAEGIVLDRTVFYPLGGGQPGDAGWLIRADGGRLAVTDTRRGGSGILHLPEADAPLPGAGERVTVVLDWERRHRHMRMHTCLHLLCSLIPAGVTGGAIRDGSGRLDFDLPGQSLDREALSTALNCIVAADHPVSSRWIDAAELDARPELVRTLSVQPPLGQGRVRLVEVAGVDLQPCGGTHVARTGEIGPVMVTRVENKGRNNRRVSVVLDAP